MKRRRVVTIFAGVILAVVVAAFVWPGAREPEYKGKTLSEYVRMLQFRGPVHVQGVDMWGPEAAEEAAKSMGTNALPWLVRWISYEPSAPTVRSALFARKCRMLKLADILSRKAGLGFFSGQFFGLLGTNALPAVSEV